MSRLFGEGRSVIVSFWHAQQLMMPLAIPRLVAHVPIISTGMANSSDGIIARFRIDAVLRLQHPEGAERCAARFASGRSGGNLALTPDGPKNPSPDR